MKRRREKQPSAILRNWLGIEDGDLSKFSFYVCLSLVGLARLLLSSDLRLQIYNARHDEALYLTRAYHLLAGEALGPYGPTLLLKLPGFSFLIAAVRSVGLSFVEALNLFFFGAGLYLVSGLRANRIARWICVLAFATFLLAPPTLDTQWFRITRENFSMCLFVVLVGATLHLASLTSRAKRGLRHLFAFSVAFALSVQLREEDRLLFLFAALVASYLIVSDPLPSKSAIFRARGTILILISFLLAWGLESGQKHLVQRWYGLPILSEIRDGEFPKLVAAIRSLPSEERNRYAMATQERLATLAKIAPEMAGVVKALTPPIREEACGHSIQCREIANTHFVTAKFAEAVHEAGFSPTLTDSQSFYRQLREKIQNACASGDITCKADGKGLFPPFQLRQTRAFTRYWMRYLGMSSQPLLYERTNPHELGEGVDMEFLRKAIATVNPHSFDTARLENHSLQKKWELKDENTFQWLTEMRREPELALQSLPKRRMLASHPRTEFFAAEPQDPSWRLSWVNSLNRFLPFLHGLGILALLASFFANRTRDEHSGFWEAFTLVLGFIFLKCASLAYVSLTMGAQQDRLFYCFQVVLSFFAVVAVTHWVSQKFAKRRKPKKKTTRFRLISAKHHGLALFVVLMLPSLAFGAKKQTASLSFELKLNPELGNYAELFESPALLAVALENIEAPLSASGKIKVHSLNAFQLTRNDKNAFEGADVSFKNRTGHRFIYEVGARVSIFSMSTTLPCEIELDLSEIKSGKGRINAFLLGGVGVPDFLTSRANTKVQMLLDPDTQKKLVAYLEKSLKRNNKVVSAELTFQKVLLDAYHRSDKDSVARVPNFEAGEDSPVGEQIFLFLAYFAWVSFAIFYGYSRRLRRGSR